jgi:hypothetical protein
MHPRLTVLTAVELTRTGPRHPPISSRLGVPRATARDWLPGAIPSEPSALLRHPQCFGAVARVELLHN